MRAVERGVVFKELNHLLRDVDGGDVLGKKSMTEGTGGTDAIKVGLLDRVGNRPSAVVDDEAERRPGRRHSG